MKKKWYKLIGIVTLFILSIVIIIFIRRPKDYVKKYVVNDFQVEESYNLDNKAYLFNITNENGEYNFVSDNKFLHKRKLINEIKIQSNENGEKCILPISKKLELYPVCYDGEHFVDYDLADLKSDDFYNRPNTRVLNSEYKNINIVNESENNYLIWANKGYYFVSEENQKELMFLNKESYYNNLSYQVGEFVITPNYDEDFTFKTIFIVNLKTDKVKKWDIEFEVSYNSYYLGDKDGVIYMFDRKEKHEYAINPRKRTIELVDEKGLGKVWNDGFEKVSTTKLANEDYKFSHNRTTLFEVSDGLQAHFNDSKRMILSNKKDIKIVSSSNTFVYYLAGDELYEYSFLRGEELLLRYNEWNFNSDNTIFIYKNDD